MPQLRKQEDLTFQFDLGKSLAQKSVLRCVEDSLERKLDKLTVKSQPIKIEQEQLTTNCEQAIAEE